MGTDIKVQVLYRARITRECAGKCPPKPVSKQPNGFLQTGAPNPCSVFSPNIVYARNVNASRFASLGWKFNRVHNELNPYGRYEGSIYGWGKSPSNKF